MVKQIQNKVQTAIQAMCVQLLNLLRETTKLPTIIKCVAYLRRIPPFLGSKDADSQLQQLFLVFRLTFIRRQWESLGDFEVKSPEKALKKHIEVFREHVYATVGGFRTIFPPDNVSNEADKDRLVAEFVRTSVNELQDTIVRLSSSITDPSARSSLWLQLAYCSQSMGRVGADFWPTTQASQDAITLEEWADALKKQRDIFVDLTKRFPAKV
jgi:hypothetical protein